MSGVVRVSETVTQYHVHVTTRSGQNKARLIEVNVSTNTFTLSNFGSNNAIVREFDLSTLQRFERLQNEVFLRLYFVSPAVSCDLSFPDLDALYDFIDIVKENNPDVVDDVIADENPEAGQDDTESAAPQTQQQQQKQQPHTVASQQSQQPDISADIQSAQIQSAAAKPVDQKKLVNKWRELLDKHGPGKQEAYKAYVRQGIPASIRAEAWIALSDLTATKNQAGLGYYRSLIALAMSEQYADVNRAIDQGLNLNDPKNAKNDNLHRVCRILRAYNVRNVNVGYSQQLVFICALLISVLDEENSFWMLSYFVEQVCCVDISVGAANSTMQNSKRGHNHERSAANLEKDKEDIIQNHLFYYHHANQLGLKIDQAAFGSLLQDKLPKIASKLQQLSIPIPPLTSRWFTAILIHTLRSDIVLRVWDCLLFDGVKALFRAYLTIFKWNEKAILKCNNRNEFISSLQEFATSPIDTNQFISTMYSMWLRSFSVSDVVHYRKLHAKVLISDQQLEESEQQRITNNLDSQLKSSSTDKLQQEQQVAAAAAAAAVEEEKAQAAAQEKQAAATKAKLEADQKTQAAIAAAKAAADSKATEESQRVAEKAASEALKAQRAAEVAAAAAAAITVAPVEVTIDPSSPIKHPIPSQTQSAPVARVIARGTHNRLFMTPSSQQRPPAINIYGSKRAFSPPIPDCYAEGELMSDYTDDEADNNVPAAELASHTLPTVVAATIKPRQDVVPPAPRDDDEAPPPPAPQDDDEAPPPPAPQDDDDAAPPPPSPSLSQQGTPVIAASLPPPLEMPPLEPTQEEPVVQDDYPVKESEPATQRLFNRPNAGAAAVGFRRPGASPVVTQIAQQNDDDDDDLPPSAEELAAKKLVQDQQLREKARQIALGQLQKQNIKDVMAALPVPADDEDKTELVEPVVDSSDDEAEQDRKEQEHQDKLAAMAAAAAAAEAEAELPPNAADDSDDDDIIDPFGKKVQVAAVPETVVEDVQAVSPSAAFRRPTLLKPKDETASLSRTASTTQPSIPDIIEANIGTETQDHGVVAPAVDHQPQPPQQEIPATPAVPQENKAKSIIQRSLLNKKNLTLRAGAFSPVPKQQLPPPPVEELPAPPMFDLPTPPPTDDYDYSSPPQQETQEAVFWPSEPVSQPQFDSYNNQDYNNGYVDPLAAITSAVGPMIDHARSCAHCQQQIYNNAVYANNQLFHPHCFQCATCRLNLTGIPYYTNNGNVYCSEHFAVSKGYVCVYCLGAVTEGLTLGSTDYAHFHCIHCAQCNARPSPYELERLASGESCIANQGTFHLSKQFQYQHTNKGMYYKFLCHTHYLASKPPSPFASPRSSQGSFQPPAGSAFSPTNATAATAANTPSFQNTNTPPVMNNNNNNNYIDPNTPCCYRCDQPLDSEITRVQGQQYHKACLVCPLCDTYLAMALKKPQGILFSDKRKGTFYCCDHTNNINLCCKSCQEPLGLESTCPQHQQRFHSYCAPGGGALPAPTQKVAPPTPLVIPSTPTATTPTQAPRTPLPQTPVQAPPAVAPSTPQVAPCTICKVADAGEPAVSIRSKLIHKKCLNCVTCQTTMTNDILKTFPALMYATVHRNFTARQPEYALQDAYYASHTMSATNQHPELPVGLICSYCYEAYVKNQ